MEHPRPLRAISLTLYSPNMSLRSRPYDTFGTGYLSDESIFQYCLDGHYGAAKQQWAKDQLKRVKTVKVFAKRKIKTSPSAEQQLTELGL